jgi:hypothetical protein
VTFLLNSSDSCLHSVRCFRWSSTPAELLSDLDGTAIYIGVILLPILIPIHPNQRMQHLVSTPYSHPKASPKASPQSIHAPIQHTRPLTTFIQSAPVLEVEHVLLGWVGSPLTIAMVCFGTFTWWIELVRSLSSFCSVFSFPHNA